jgi:hypothetical protein
LHKGHALYLFVSKEPRRRKILRKHHQAIIEHLVPDWIGAPQTQSIQNEDRRSVGGEREFLQELSPIANLSDERTHVEHNKRPSPTDRLPQTIWLKAEVAKALG